MDCSTGHGVLQSNAELRANTVCSGQGVRLPGFGQGAKPPGSGQILWAPKELGYQALGKYRGALDKHRGLNKQSVRTLVGKMSGESNTKPCTNALYVKALLPEFLPKCEIYAHSSDNCSPLRLCTKKHAPYGRGAGVGFLM